MGQNTHGTQFFIKSNLLDLDAMLLTIEMKLLTMHHYLQNQIEVNM